MFSWTAGYVDNVANSKREFALVPEMVFIRVQLDREFLLRILIHVGWKESRFLERNTLLASFH